MNINKQRTGVQIALPKKRTPIPEQTKHRVLLASEYRCCICREKKVVLHHINGDPSDNEDSNLAVLCHPHHDDAHTKRGLSQNLTPQAIRNAKKQWEADVSTARKDRVSLQSEDGIGFRYWSYHNTGLLFDLCQQAGVATNRGEYYKQLSSSKIIDSTGLPLVAAAANHTGKLETIYSTLAQPMAQRLNLYLARLVDKLIFASSPTQIDLTWPRSAVKLHMAPSKLVFLSRDFRFRVIEKNQGYELRAARASANGTTVEFQFDTRTVFSSSSLSSHFAGHGVVAALLLTRSATRDDENPRKWLVKTTPVALGTGFPSLTGPKPAIAYVKEAEQDQMDDDLLD